MFWGVVNFRSFNILYSSMVSSSSMKHWLAVFVSGVLTGAHLVSRLMAPDPSATGGSGPGPEPGLGTGEPAGLPVLLQGIPAPVDLAGISFERDLTTMSLTPTPRLAWLLWWVENLARNTKLYMLFMFCHLSTGLLLEYQLFTWPLRKGWSAVDCFEVWI